MLFDNLTPNLKTALYPTPDRLSFSNITIKDYLADIKIDFTFLFKDLITVTKLNIFDPFSPERKNIFGQVLKIGRSSAISWEYGEIVGRHQFTQNNEPSLVFGKNNISDGLQKYIKIKIFAMNEFTKNILSDPNFVSTIENIEKIIVENNLSYYNFNMKEDFLGNKNKPEEHLEESQILNIPSTNKIESTLQKKNLDLNLFYKNSLIIKSSGPNKFLSLGVVFYIDLPEYIKEEKPSVEFIENNKILFNSGVTIFNIFDSDGNLVADQAYSEKISDLRETKKFFTKTDELNQLYEKTLFNPNKVLETIQALSKKASLMDNKNIFSNLFSSKSWKYGNHTDLQEQNFLFFIDFKKLFVKNSSFFYKASRTQKTIDSLRFLRRRCLYNEKTKKIEKIIGEPILIAETSGEPRKLPHKTSINGAIKENNTLKYLSDIGGDAIIAIEAKDTNLYSLKDGKYQYGIELKTSDSFFSLLEEKRQSLLNKQTILDSLKLDCQIKSNYNAYTGLFSSLYKNEFNNTIFSDNKTKLAFVVQLISEFIDTLQILNLLPLNDDKTFTLIKNLLVPESSSQEKIEYFSKIYTNFILRIEELLKDKKLKHTIATEIWFSDIFDASEPNVGYIYNYSFEGPHDGFLRNTPIGNLAILSENQKNILYYSSNNLTPEEVEYRYAIFGPSVLQMADRSKFFFLNRTNEDFSGLEAKIRSYKNSKTYNEENILSQNQNTNNTILYSKILENSSIVVKNLFKNSTEQELISQNGSIVNTSINEQIDPNLLMSIVKNKITNTSVKDKYVREDFISPGTTPPTLLNKSFQVNDLILNGGKFFSGENSNYLTNLKINSRFLLLYQTLVQVQILVSFYYNSTSETTSLTLTSWDSLYLSTFNLLPKGKYLCRLVKSPDTAEFLNKRQEIELPVFDQYFILTKE